MNKIPGIEVRFTPKSGVRNIDVFKQIDVVDYAVNVIGKKLRGIETKIGRTGKGSRELKQIQKDIELLLDGQLDEIVWKIGCIPTTGLSGPSAPLRKFFDDLNDPGALGFAISVLEVPCKP